MLGMHLHIQVIMLMLIVLSHSFYAEVSTCKVRVNELGLMMFFVLNGLFAFHFSVKLSPDNF